MEGLIFGILRYYFFSSPNGDRTAIIVMVIRATQRSRLSCTAKGVTSFVSYFKTLSNGPALGIEPTTSRSAVKRSTD